MTDAEKIARAFEQKMAEGIAGSSTESMGFMLDRYPMALDIAKILADSDLAAKVVADVIQVGKAYADCDNSAFRDMCVLGLLGWLSLILAVGYGVRDTEEMERMVGL